MRSFSALLLALNLQPYPLDAFLVHAGNAVLVNYRVNGIQQDFPVSAVKGCVEPGMGIRHSKFYPGQSPVADYVKSAFYVEVVSVWNVV